MPRKQGRSNVGYSLEARPRVSGKPAWRVRIWVDDPATGTKKPQIVGTYPTKGEAQRAGAKAVQERDRGTLLKPNETTVAQLLDLWLAQEMPKTVDLPNRENYRIIVDRHIKPALGAIKVQRLTTQAIETFYAQLSEAGYSSSLIRKCHLRLSAAMKLAKRWGWVAENPCEGATAPKTRTKPPQVWTAAETGKFLAVAEKDGLSPIWQLAVETGARTSELLGLCWSDLDITRGTLTIGRRAVRLVKGTPIIKDDAKTAAGRRTIRLTAETVTALQEHHDRQQFRRKAATEWADLDLVFCTATGKPIEPNNFRRSFDRLVKQAGVRRITPHSLRKSHITNLIAAGANVKAVAARVGHKDISTTLATYTALVPQMEDELQQLVEVLSAAQRAPQAS